MEEKVKAFLKELEELTNKHGMYVGWGYNGAEIADIKDNKLIADGLVYTYEGTYECNITEPYFIRDSKGNLTENIISSR